MLLPRRLALGLEGPTPSLHCSPARYGLLWMYMLTLQLLVPGRQNSIHLRNYTNLKAHCCRQFHNIDLARLDPKLPPKLSGAVVMFCVMASNGSGVNASVGPATINDASTKVRGELRTTNLCLGLGVRLRLFLLWQWCLRFGFTIRARMCTPAV